MLVQTRIDPSQEQPWRYMKMACGENPKVNNKTSVLRLIFTNFGYKPVFF